MNAYKNRENGRGRFTKRRNEGPVNQITKYIDKEGTIREREKGRKRGKRERKLNYYVHGNIK